MADFDMDLVVGMALGEARQHGRVQYGNGLFGLPPASESTVYRPVGGYYLGMNLEIPTNAMMMVRAYRDAELYRIAVLDEDFPGPRLDRTLMILCLGWIGYRRAIPELREAMLHDRDESIRGVATEALGYLGAREHLPEIIGVLRHDTNDAKHSAVESLGMIGDCRALFPLRDLFEETLLRVRTSEFAGNRYPVAVPDGWWELTEVLGAMLAIGGELADRSLEEAYNEGDLDITQAANRAAFRARMLKAGRYSGYYAKRRERRRRTS